MTEKGDMKMTINELIERAHGQAKAMGWWDGERNTGEVLMLIVSECGKALEAHRSGRVAKRRDLLTTYDAGMRLMDSVGLIHVVHGKPRQPSFTPHRGDESYDEAEWFEFLIKDTFEDELADIVIRIADLFGGLGIIVHPENGEQELLSIYRGDDSDSDNVGEQLLEVVKELLNTNASMGLRLWDAMLAVGRICYSHDIDLWRHIDLKLKYNLTRGRKHGKSY